MVTFLGITPSIDDDAQGFSLLNCFLTSNYMDAWASVWKADTKKIEIDKGVEKPETWLQKGLSVLKNHAGELWDCQAYFYSEIWVFDSMIYKRSIVMHFDITKRGSG